MQHSSISFLVSIFLSAEIQKVYGDAALSEITCHDWFLRFKVGDFEVDD